MQINTQAGRNMKLMQSGDLKYAAEATDAELRSRIVSITKWPSFSPDLDPVEEFCNTMKDHIDKNHGEDISYSSNTLRGAIKEAWDSITPAMLLQLLSTVTQHMQDLTKKVKAHAPRATPK